MNEAAFFDLLLPGSFALAAAAGIYLVFSAAPYGRHGRRGFGPLLNNALGWLLMELPAVLMPIIMLALSSRRDLVICVFVLFWQAHYLDRALFYPLRIRGRGTPVPLVVALSGALFNVLNGYLNFRYLTHFGPYYATDWLRDPRFLTGAVLFVVGFVINRQADRTLRSLRAPGETGYKIPEGGLYRFISCPNYFGEFIEWCGWALMTFAWPGLFFAVFTAANLFPRALSHHRDYRRRFPGLSSRRAVVPFIL